MDYWTNRAFVSDEKQADPRPQFTLSRQKYDVLREPQWFLDRVEDAFGPVRFLQPEFDLANDTILNRNQENESVFIVPPFSVAAKFLEKAHSEIVNRPDSTIMFLISSRTEAFSWHDHVFGVAHLLFLRSPFRFVGLDRGLSGSFIIFGKCPDESVSKLTDLGTFIKPEGAIPFTF